MPSVGDYITEGIYTYRVISIDTNPSNNPLYKTYPLNSTIIYTLFKVELPQKYYYALEDYTQEQINNLFTLCTDQTRLKEVFDSQFPVSQSD